MKLDITQVGNENVAEVLAEGVVIRTPQGALALLMAAQYQHDATCLILYEKNVVPGFFDLKTGLAGDVLQKCTNYGMKARTTG